MTEQEILMGIIVKILVIGHFAEGFPGHKPTRQFLLDPIRIKRHG